VNTAEAVVNSLVPTLLIAATLKTYPTPLESPVTVAAVADDGERAKAVQLAPALLLY